MSICTTGEYFDIEGLRPAVQMLMMRYWKTHGSPATLKTLPRGDVHIQDHGAESFQHCGKQVQLRKYLVRGLIWGSEALWLDAQDRLIALVSIDAEMDHFEAVADGYEDGLAAFITSAAKDGMASLAKVASGFSAHTKLWSPLLAAG